MTVLDVLMFIWQLPQNLAGLFIFLLCTVFDSNCMYTSDGICMPEHFFDSGVSLGRYIIMQRDAVTQTSIKHEDGHRKQSRILGPLYLVVIGLPSFLGNLFARMMRRKWGPEKTVMYYYSQPWERWADVLGNVGSRW